MTSLRSISLFAACSVGAASLAAAQAPPLRRELVGIVRDPSGTGIEGATVEIRGAAAGTNANGAFQLWTNDIDTVTISIRRLGYLPVSAQLSARGGQWDTVVVEMERTSQRLSAVTVTGGATRRALGLRDFDARRAIGNGIFVTRDEITARNTTRLTDVLQNKRGIRVVRLRSGVSGVRFASYSHTRSSCAPNVWIDGQWARDLEVDELPATDVEAVEIYETLASVPFEFTPQGSAIPCGTIVIWTRIPGQR
jgi:hypothetical protein